MMRLRIVVEKIVLAIRRRFARPKAHRQVFLHIGMHKTGSSAIQRFLRANAKLLRENGLKFFYTRGQPSNLGNVIGFSGSQDDGVRFFLNESSYAELLAFIDAHPSHGILSGEDLCFLPEPQARRLARDLRARFDHITVLIYLRRQDRMAVSCKAQGARTPQQAVLFGVEDTPLPRLTPAVGSYLDYASLLTRWRRVLPDARMIVVPYDRDHLRGGDAVSDFLYRLGLPDSVVDQTKVNVSFGGDTTRLFWLLRRIGLTAAELKQIQKLGIVADSGGGFDPSREEARKFLSMFAKSNQKLARLTNGAVVFDDDVSSYPERQAADPLRQDYLRETLGRLVEVPDLSETSRASIRKYLAEMVVERGTGCS